MQDQHTGQAGTFIVDPEAGIRVPAEEWEAYQAAKADPATEKPTKKPSKHTTEEPI